MADIDPLDADDLGPSTHQPTNPAEDASPAGMDALPEQAADDVLAKLVTGIARRALDAALTPERLEALEARTAAAVERALQHDETDHSVPELVFGSVDEWLRKYWRYTYRRRVSAKGTGTGRWKAEWWNTDEAVQRLETLWRGWEASRLDPGLGTSAWWINHAVPHMTALLAIDGPFAGSTDENGIGDPLPYRQPPEHLFPPDRQPETATEHRQNR